MFSECVILQKGTKRAELPAGHIEFPVRNTKVLEKDEKRVLRPSVCYHGAHEEVCICHATNVSGTIILFATIVIYIYIARSSV